MSTSEQFAPVAGAGHRIGVLTSGGDAPGMNAAVRAVVRAAISAGAEPFAIHEGWRGVVLGGSAITPITWGAVSSILSKGGTIIGTARCPEFRERESRLKGAQNLVELGIDRLVVVGGDGSLTGADTFQQEWPELLAELVVQKRITASRAARHPKLVLVGLVGSIDNDLVGSDMTIGADTALHRIVTAIDELSSTAAAHQRTFVIEVMGRHCGYLALMAAVAGGCDYVFIPEDPPALGWEDDLCHKLRAGREAGRRESIVLLAEGAIDSSGTPITSAQITELLDERLGEDTRVTILGHVQRGGPPSAYDRWMPTLLGCQAVQEVLTTPTPTEPVILGVRQNRIARIPLVEAVAATRRIADLITEKRFPEAVTARGRSFARTIELNRIMSTPPGPAKTIGAATTTAESATPTAADTPPQTVRTEKVKRIALMHVGGLAAGMNVAARTAVRIGLDRGWTMLGVQGGVPGLINGAVTALNWEDVEGWVSQGGAELGTRREIPQVEQRYSLARAIEDQELDGILLIGGLNAYLTAEVLWRERDRYPAFNIPVVLVPTSIDNNLPGSELAIGADTALNNAVWALDRIKQSASAARRCFVAETMGRRCGYLALMSGIATGAERVYLPEEGIHLSQLSQDAHEMCTSFRRGRRLFLVIRSERASELYNTDFLARIFAEEGAELFDVRQSVLGHLQQGGEPTPFDRLLAMRLVHRGMDVLAAADEGGKAEIACVGVKGEQIVSQSLAQTLAELDRENRRPREQWWLGLRPVIGLVSTRN